MKIYIPVRVMQSLSDNARHEFLTLFSEPMKYTTPPVVHLVEDDVYVKMQPMLSQVVELHEKINEAERELKYLREVKKSVDAMKKLFK
jgi:hypothetical protein